MYNHGQFISCKSTRLPDSQHLCGGDAGAELEPNICNKTQLRKQRQSSSWSRHASHVSQCYSILRGEADALSRCNCSTTLNIFILLQSPFPRWKSWWVFSSYINLFVLFMCKVRCHNCWRLCAPSTSILEHRQTSSRACMSEPESAFVLVWHLGTVSGSPVSALLT